MRISARQLPSSTRRSTRRSVLTVVAVLVALVWAFPVYWMVNSAFLDKVTLQRPRRPSCPSAARSTTSARSSATRDSFAL